ncbi:TPA: adenylosuccinate synthase [Candidatus Scatenecus faecavium]|uniref:Adenylosuccinate synthetase n=1 Tax=Candidatus Scatenecus faecavium TaxID=2840915 RepID=A0A9D1FWS2_9BACT|nr:adenylosuccinate synthase [Candidatus Scatenecus faecavium]
MTNKVVVGSQWGDEGKAKITDILAHDADLIIRYQGGCNAGHTVVADNKTYKFHLIPSGILYKGKTCFLGAGTVILPEAFQKEVGELIEQGIDVSGLKISPLASITMPYHTEVDGYSENTAGKGKIGTTKKGIGPTYTDKAARIGLKIGDLYNEETLNEKLDIILPLKNKQLEKVYGLQPYTKECILALCENYAKIFKPYVCFEWQELLENSSRKQILFEGAQGVMLDVDYGTYPFVTSSNPIGGGAATGSGYGPTMIDEVIGVAKAYVTRVGEGPFVTELTDETGKKIQEIGHEFGVTTGRARRCGWFDAVIMKYSVLVGGLTSIALTKADVFDTFDEIKVCTAYKDKRDGKIYKHYPTDVFMHKYLEPVYETHQGWKTDISGIREYEKLPENCRKYLERLEELLGVPVSIVSVGPDREQTIFR